MAGAPRRGAGQRPSRPRVVARAPRARAAAADCIRDLVPLVRPRPGDRGAALDGASARVRRAGDLERARGLYAEGLSLAVESGDRARVVEFLDGVARLAGASRDPVRAALLWGAAEAGRAEIGVMEIWDIGDYERCVAAASE